MKFSVKLLLAAAIAVLALGCGGKRDRMMTMDPVFSINVMEVPSDFPLEDKDWPEDPRLAMQMQQTYARYGTPDFFRIRWRKDGKLMRHDELFAEMWSRKDKGRADKYARQRNPEIDWIYLNEELLISFDKGKTAAEEETLPDWLLRVTEYGDPEEIKESQDAVGPNMIYQYYSEGKVFYFRDGEEYRVETLPAMPAFTMQK